MPLDLDLHPDELLHRARLQRALSRDERIYLDAHLRICSTCRFIRDAGAAFDDEAAACPPAQVDALVNRTMASLRANPGRSRRPRPRRLAAGALTVVAMIGGVAFAGYWGSRHPLRETRPAVTTPAPPQAPHRRRGVPAGPAPTDVADVPALPVAAPPPPVVEAPVPAAPSRGPTSGRASHGETPARLFETANRARRQGEIAVAEAAYSALWTKFRASREAIASRAIAGQWMLDRGEPRAAIGLFRQYLAATPTGDLEEDVLVGLAESHEQIGASAAAAATWRQVLEEHPGSVHADRARLGLRRTQAQPAP